MTHSQGLVYKMERFMFGMPSDYKDELDHIIKLVKTLRTKKWKANTLGRSSRMAYEVFKFT